MRWQFAAVILVDVDIYLQPCQLCFEREELTKVKLYAPDLTSFNSSGIH